LEPALRYATRSDPLERDGSDLHLIQVELDQAWDVVALHLSRTINAFHGAESE
jgi:hypothetical protein